VYTKLAKGEELVVRILGHRAKTNESQLPNFGMETVHHVHADDVAQAFMLALAQPSACIGESFHVVSPAAVTLRGFAQAIARFYGKEVCFHFTLSP
jgi:nucleoside-diphosphate-sugar epimerase